MRALSRAINNIIIIAFNIIITILLLTSFSYGQDSLDKTNSESLNKTILQIKKKISGLENIKQEILSGDLSETRKTQIKEELYYYIEKGFSLINNPANEKLLIYMQHIIAGLLTEAHVSIFNDFITIAKLNLTTEEKIELFYATNGSTAYETCYTVFVTGFFVLVMALLLGIIFGKTLDFTLLYLSLYMTAIGLALAAIGLICMLLSL